MTTNEAKTLLTEHYSEGTARTIIEAILAAERTKLISGEVYCDRCDGPYLCQCAEGPTEMECRADERVKAVAAERARLVEVFVKEMHAERWGISMGYRLGLNWAIQQITEGKP